jgi:peptidoglycan/xylan/chitin deacetylase (PgdA/CDA1 family)
VTADMPKAAVFRAFRVFRGSQVVGGVFRTAGAILSIATLTLVGCSREGPQGEVAGVPAEDTTPQPPAPRNIPILCMHDLGANAQNDYSIKTADLEAYLQWLSDEGFETVTVRDVIAYLDGELELPEKPIVLSFDDNWKSALTVARPALEKRGFVGVAFVISSSVGANENKLSWDDCKALAEAGWEIGSHSKTHENLTYVKPGQSTDSIRDMVEAEIRDSKETIEGNTGLEVVSIALPYGNYDTFVLDTIQDAGYRAALTIDRGSADEQSDPFRLPRRMIMNATAFTTFKRICTTETLHIADLDPEPGSRLTGSSVTLSGKITDDDVSAAPSAEIQGKRADVSFDAASRALTIEGSLSRGANAVSLTAAGREVSWLVVLDD